MHPPDRTIPTARNAPPLAHGAGASIATDEAPSPLTSFAAIRPRAPGTKAEHMPTRRPRARTQGRPPPSTPASATSPLTTHTTATALTSAAAAESRSRTASTLASSGSPPPRHAAEADRTNRHRASKPERRRPCSDLIHSPARRRPGRVVPMWKSTSRPGPDQRRRSGPALADYRRPPGFGTLRFGLAADEVSGCTDVRCTKPPLISEGSQRIVWW